jgi:hypothetical protein
MSHRIESHIAQLQNLGSLKDSGLHLTKVIIKLRHHQGIATNP